MKYTLLILVAASHLVATAFAAPIHVAVIDGNFRAVYKHLAAGADVNAKIDDNGQTPLHMAAYRGNKEIGELLISNGADVNAKDKQFSETPLHKAAFSGRNEFIKLLITNGADANAKRGMNINVKDRLGATPLDHSLSRKKYETAELLRKHGGRTGPEDVEYKFESLQEAMAQLQHLIIRDTDGNDFGKPSIEKNGVKKKGS